MTARIKSETGQIKSDTARIKSSPSSFDLCSHRLHLQWESEGEGERGAKSLNIEHVGAVYDRPNQVRNGTNQIRHCPNQVRKDRADRLICAVIDCTYIIKSERIVQIV